jgi:hypothetical protein
MRKIKIIPTRKVWRKSDGRRVVINVSDYDPMLYSDCEPVTEKQKPEKRNKKAE